MRALILDILVLKTSCNLFRSSWENDSIMPDEAVVVDINININDTRLSSAPHKIGIIPR